jgi:ribulose-phosphate 3-epimerase
VIIPSINAQNQADAAFQIKVCSTFLSKKTGWLHLDFSDGEFGSIKTWGNLTKWFTLSAVEGGHFNKNYSTEVHLMVRRPEKFLIPCAKAGVKRVIIHLESLSNFKKIFLASQALRLELALAINPETSASQLLLYPKVSFFTILAVHPGKSGQKSHSNTINKIKFLRAHFPKAKIEVDGGVNVENIKSFKAAGTTNFVVHQAIFKSDDYKNNYLKLKKQT